MLHGNALILKERVNTDEIISGKYLRNSDSSIWGEHIFEALGADICQAAKRAKYIIANEEFGIGSSREQAALAIKHNGIQMVFAKSFGNIFFRNLINNGILAFEHNGSQFSTANLIDEVQICFKSCSIINKDGTKLDFKPIDPLLGEIVRSGGLLDYYMSKGKLSKVI